MGAGDGLALLEREGRGLGEADLLLLRLRRLLLLQVLRLLLAESGGLTGALPGLALLRLRLLLLLLLLLDRAVRESVCWRRIHGPWPAVGVAQRHGRLVERLEGGGPGCDAAGWGLDRRCGRARCAGRERAQVDSGWIRERRGMARINSDDEDDEEMAEEARPPPSSPSTALELSVARDQLHDTLTGTSQASAAFPPEVRQSAPPRRAWVERLLPLVSLLLHRSPLELSPTRQNRQPWVSQAPPRNSASRMIRATLAGLKVSSSPLSRPRSPHSTRAAVRQS